MTGIILIVTGVIFIGAGLFAGGLINTILGTVGAVPEAADAMGGMANGMSTIFTVAFGGVGVLMVLGGLFSLLRGRKAGQQHQAILASGVQTEGQVTFVDKNYSVLINNAPVYSIVEYTYTDGSGMQHTNRIDRVSTESVIRSGIAVGSTIQVKYLMEDPSKSTIVPGSATQTAM